MNGKLLRRNFTLHRSGGEVALAEWLVAKSVGGVVKSGGGVAYSRVKGG
jgi:hypothetical protein